MKKFYRQISVLLLLLLFLISAAPSVIADSNVSVSISPDKATLNLSGNRTIQMSSGLSNSAYASQLEWKSSNESKATVDKNGLVTAKKVSTVKIGVRVPGKTKWSLATITITNSNGPTSIYLNHAKASLNIGEQLELNATVMPSSASQQVGWVSSKPSVAIVDSNGVVTAKASGTATIRAYSKVNTKIRKDVKITVKAMSAPTDITLNGNPVMQKGEKQTLGIDITPSTASQSVKWSTSDATVASVSKGVVTAKKAGTVTITARSSVKSSVSASFKITVVDPGNVTEVTINSSNLYLFISDTKQLSATITPSTATATVTWSSSNPVIASVTTSGKVTALKTGTATITASAGKVSSSIVVRVLSTERSTIMPAKYLTLAAGISDNSNKIQDVYKSAELELDCDVAKGMLSYEESRDRLDMIQSGFRMYDIAWSPKANVSYWSGNGSYYSSSFFYFGLPYSQNNRTYNETKWLSAVGYTKKSNYYKVSLPNKTYPANDCSSFVSMCNYGLNNAFSALNTTQLMTSSAYKTISNGFTSLIPGDILVKYGHTCIFLYYVDPDNIIVLENGGGDEPNCVGVARKSISQRYKPEGYIVRRRADLPTAN